MVTVKIQDTQVPQTIKNDFLAKSYDIESNDAIDLIKLVVYSIAEFLGEVKDKSTKKIGLRIVDNSEMANLLLALLLNIFLEIQKKILALGHYILHLVKMILRVVERFMKVQIKLS